MAMLETNVNELEHSRSVLLRVIRSLSNEQHSFSDDGSMNNTGETDLIDVLQLHETIIGDV
jgi:hypothetical protein